MIQSNRLAACAGPAVEAQRAVFALLRVSARKLEARIRRRRRQWIVDRASVSLDPAEALHLWQPAHREGQMSNAGRRLTRRSFVVGAAGLSSLPFIPAAAQERRARIGFVTAQREAAIAPNFAFVRAGLSSEGLSEGQNLTIEYRYCDDSLERVREAARGLSASGVDLIVAQGSAVPQIISLNLPTPLVYITSADPILSGYAESLAKPLGPKTGLTFMVYEFASKRLE
ncbi:MAG: hypothetical protein M9883_07455, partial [Methylobacteriaceae bacterium]|nr:hypothetical protein [Methylobacteriaceae bacterium]